MTGWNLPPGVTGNEREIAGLTKEEEAICESCPFTDSNGECNPNRPDCPLTLKEVYDNDQTTRQRNIKGT